MSFSSFCLFPRISSIPEKKRFLPFDFSISVPSSYIQKSFPQCGACGCFHFHFFPNPYIAFQVPKYFSWNVSHF